MDILTTLYNLVV